MEKLGLTRKYFIFDIIELTNKSVLCVVWYHWVGDPVVQVQGGHAAQEQAEREEDQQATRHSQARRC